MSQLKILLERDYLADKTIGCLSYIKNGKIYQFSTIEPRWLDNKKNISCIHEGEFNGGKYPSKKFGNTYILGVTGRTGILFHWGNREKDTEGCIIIGEYFEMHKNSGPYLKNSTKAFKEFIESLKDTQDFILLVKKRA